MLSVLNRKAVVSETVFKVGQVVFLFDTQDVDFILYIIAEKEFVIEDHRDVGDFNRAFVKSVLCIQVIHFKGLFSLCRNVGFGNVLFLSVDGQAYRDIVNVFVGRVDKGDGDFVVLVFLVKNLVELNIFDVQVVCVFRLEDKEDRVGQCICSNLLKIAIDGLEVGKEKQGCFFVTAQFPGCPEDFGQGPGMGGDLKCGDGVDGLFLGKGREVLVVVGEKEKVVPAG